MQSLDIKSFIQKKKDGKEHSIEELKSLIEAYTKGEVPDYQMSAWLMAVCWRGLSPQETQQLTLEMAHSGKKLHRESREDYWIDKHSTGGIGDKCSLILVPLLTSVCNTLFSHGAVKIPMISGRALGHTGGTLDKLESLPGFSASIPLQRALELLSKNGFFMMGQTSELAPADKLLYSLRDATATVESIPLIVASILSKKLCESLDGIVLDVKIGEGTHLQNEIDSRLLATKLLEVAKNLGMEAVVIFSRMDEPLGKTAGNLIELEECADYLLGKERESGLHEVILELAGWMLHLASRRKMSLELAKEKCTKELSGEGPIRYFRKMFEAQGANWESFQELKIQRKRLPHHSVVAERVGYVAKLKTKSMGLLINRLGGGRSNKEAQLDPLVGIEWNKKVGDRVEPGETLFTIFYRDDHQLPFIRESINDSVEIVPQPVKKQSWILGIAV